MTTTPPATPPYNFIIVGGGTAGSLLAARLASAPTRPRILLIEAGIDSRPHGNDLRVAFDRWSLFLAAPHVSYDYETVPQRGYDGRAVPYARVAPADDYERWAELVGDEVWRWGSVAEMHRRIVSLHTACSEETQQYVRPTPGLHTQDAQFDASYPWRPEVGTELCFEAARAVGWPVNLDLNSGDPIGFGIMPNSIYRGMRTTSASAFLGQPPQNLKILTTSRVDKVLFEGTTARGVQLAGGEQFFAEKEVLLCAGTIDSARLLLLSGIGPKDELERHGIPVVADRSHVGKNLADHPLTAFTALMEPGTNLKKKARENWVAESAKDDSPWLRANGTGVIGFFKVPEALQSTLALDLLDDADRAHLQKPGVPHFEFCVGPVFPVPNRAFQPGESVNTYSVILQGLQSRGSVTLASADPAANPLIDTATFTHPYDVSIALAAFRAALEFAKSPPMAEKTLEFLHAPKSDSDEDILRFVRETTGPCWHACGTVKMGRDGDETACVDTEFRVIGVERLRVVDLSVAPLLPNCHTQSVALLIAQIAAEKLARSYGLGDLPVRV